MPVDDGVCLVGESPESRRWAMAMISTNAPAEPDAPSWYWITPPDEAWPAAAGRGVARGVQRRPRCPPSPCTRSRPGTSRTTRRCAGPAATCGGRCSPAPSSRAGRTTPRSCASRRGSSADDPRFAVGVWLEALVRVTRLACALGVHTAGWTVQEAAARFEADTHLAGPAAASEARRATFDPTYGRYTWGKLEIMALRERARSAWGRGLHAQALPHRADGPRLAAPGPDRNRDRPGVDCFAC